MSTHRTRHLLQGRNEQGLTLVELMVTLLLAAILTIGLFYMASGQSETYEVQMSQLSTQENLWGTMVYLSRETMKAGQGFGACPGGQIMMYDPVSTTATPVKQSPIVALRVYNDCNLLTTDVSVAGSCPDGSGVDSMTITYTEDEVVGNLLAARLTKSMIASHAEIEIRSAGGFQKDDLLVLLDPAAPWCTLLKATDIPASWGGGYSIPHDEEGEYNPPSDQNIFPGTGYRIGSLVVRLGPSAVPRHFAVDNSQDPPRLVTWRTNNVNPSSDTGNLEVVADGVEDMQLAWAWDQNSNGVYEEGTPSPSADEWIYNATGDAEPAVPRPEVLRITLISRTASPDIKYERGFRPAAEDRAAGSISEDKALSENMGTYFRSVLTAVIKLRNIATWI